MKFDSSGFLVRLAKMLTLATVTVVITSGCNSGKGSVQIDPVTGWERSDDSDGRETIVITAPENNVVYRYGSAYVDTLMIRHLPIASEQDRAVIEVLVKGSLADGCTELHEVIQGRQNGAITLSLRTRRPENELCTMAVRPFRFYLVLNEKLAPGNYSLAVEERTYPFSVHISSG